jgi:hypothetical protein
MPEFPDVFRNVAQFVEENIHVFPFMEAVQALAGAGAWLRRQLQAASVDVAALTALIISALLSVDAVGPKAVAAAAVGRLLDAARQHITQFVTRMAVRSRC